MKPIYAAICAFSMAVLVEFSQIYKADWIEQIRNTTIGGLLLGHSFTAVDLIRYFSGAIIALLADRFLINRQKTA